MPYAKNKGIIVLGAPRSGTTLFRRLLDAHPAIACPGETFLLKSAARFLQGDTIGCDVDYGVLGGLQAAGFAEEEVLARLRALCFGFMDDAAARAGKPRWAIKTAVDSFYLPEIEKVFSGHASFVCILRNGLDVIASLKEFSDEMQTYVEELHRYVQRDARPLDAFARAWVDVTEDLLGFEARHRENTKLVRYEDLVADPHGTMSGVLAFFGEAWDPAILDAALENRQVDGIGDWKAYGRSAVDAKSVGRWEALPQATVERLAKIVNPTLEACGYDRVADVDDRDARRRQELAKMLMGAARSG